jgi:hypothetical protein
MNKLKIQCAASPETNDHAASIFVDGEDWLGDEYMGLDPPRLFRQKTLLSGGRALVGRCNCGCEGCDDFIVDVIIDENEVKWKSPKGYLLRFDRTEYDSEIVTKRNDHCWEDNNRTAERLVDAVFDSIVLSDGCKYDWSSARIGKGKITLSFSLNSQQKLIEFGWDPEDPVTAEKRARQLKREMVSE